MNTTHGRSGSTARERRRRVRRGSGVDSRGHAAGAEVGALVDRCRRVLSQVTMTILDGPHISCTATSHTSWRPSRLTRRPSGHGPPYSVPDWECVALRCTVKLLCSRLGASLKSSTSGLWPSLDDALSDVTLEDRRPFLEDSLAIRHQPF